MLRFLERVQERDLARTRRWIQNVQQLIAEQARRRPPPPPPDWAVQYGVGGRAIGPAMVHTAQCWTPGASMEGINRTQAIDALTRDGVPPCILCRPEKELGVLE